LISHNFLYKNISLSDSSLLKRVIHSAIIFAIEMTRILLHFLASLFKGIEFVTTNSSIADLFSLSIAGPERTGWVI
jgi:hypothetical protein